MSVTFRRGDITKFSEGIIINPVNCDEPPKSKTAINLAELYPENQTRFDEQCALGLITPNKPHIVRLDNGNCIINVSDKNINDFDKSLRIISQNIEKIKEHCDGAKSLGFPSDFSLKWDLVRNKILDSTLNRTLPIFIYGEAESQKFDLSTQKEEMLILTANVGNPLTITSIKDGGVSKDQKWHDYFVQFDRDVDPTDLNTFLKATLGLKGGTFSRKQSPSGSGIGKSSGKATKFDRFTSTQSQLRGKFKIVDPEGNPVDEHGNLLNAKGKIINIEGKIIKEAPFTLKDGSKGKIIKGRIVTDEIKPTRIVASSVKKHPTIDNMIEVKIGRQIMRNKKLNNSQIASAIRLYASDINKGFR